MNSNPSNRKVIFLIVSNVDQEQQVLARLEKEPSRAGGLIAPVLDVQDLLPRLRSALRFAGYETQCVEWNDSFKTELQSPRVERPEVVFFAEGVDFATARLAAALCGSAPIPIKQIGVKNSWRARTALVLLSSSTHGDHENLAALETLAAQGVSMGFIRANDPFEMRFRILKSLLISSFTSKGLFSILDFNSKASESSPSGHDQIVGEQDILVFGGHANGLDAQFGPNHVLCARDSSPNAEGAVFPCFHSGRCFRIGGTAGHLPLTRVKPEDVKSRVVIATGCNLTTLSNSWYRMEHGLVSQLERTNVLALLVTAGLCSSIPEMDLYAISLIAEGWQIGEVVRHINSIRTEELGLQSGMPNGLGPLLVFGNPCLRCEEWPLHIADSSASVQNQEVFINGTLPNLGPSSESAIVRVPITAIQTRTPYMNIHRFPNGYSALGVWHRSLEHAAIYFWVRPDDQRHPSSTTAQADGAFTFECTNTNPTRSLVNFLERFATEMCFWPAFLVSYEREMKEEASATDLIKKTQSAIPIITLNVLRTRGELDRFPGVLVDTTKLLAGVYTPIAQQVSALTGSLLQIAVTIAVRLGSLQFLGWQPQYSRGKAFGPVATCSCDNGLVYGQRFELPGHKRHVRALYQCSACGPVGEDDGRRMMTVGMSPQHLCPGDDIELRCHLTAPSSEAVYGSLCAVLECWYKEREMLGIPTDVVLQPGAVKVIQLNVSVPFDLDPGIYVCAVIGVLNGALYISRRMVEVAKKGF